MKIKTNTEMMASLDMVIARLSSGENLSADEWDSIYYALQQCAGYAKRSRDRLKSDGEDREF